MANKTYLNHNRQHGSVQRECHQAIHGECNSSDGAEFLQTAYAAVDTDEENGNLKGIVPEDDVADTIERFENDVAGCLHPTVFLGLEHVRVSHHSARKAERFVEADSADQEGQSLGHRNGIEGNVQ